MTADLRRFWCRVFHRSFWHIEPDGCSCRCCAVRWRKEWDGRARGGAIGYR